MCKTLEKVFQTDAAAWYPLPIRLTLGAVFIGHGAQKLFGWWGGFGLQATAHMFADKMHMEPGILWASLAGGGEFFGGLLVLLGLITRFGALNIAVVMMVAILQVHWGKFFMQEGGMEYPLSLLGAALALLIAGGGKFSVDACLQRKFSDKQ